MLISVPLLLLYGATVGVAFRSDGAAGLDWLRENIKLSFFASLGIAAANLITARPPLFVIPFSMLWTSSIFLPFLFVWRQRSIRKKSSGPTPPP